MLRSLLTVTLFASVLAAASTPGEKRAGTDPSRLVTLRQSIDAVLNDTILSSSFIGVKIVRAETGEVLYSRDSHKLFHPASNMKVLTTSTAIAELPFDFMVKTMAYADERLEDGVLAGNLYVKGFGDGMFDSEDMDSLAGLIVEHGIGIIAGDVVGDASYFDDLYWGSGWMWDDEPESYEAFISPLTVNANSIAFHVLPGSSNGEPARVIVDPPVGFYEIVNTAITSTDTMLPEVKVTRPKRENVFQITGAIHPLEDTVHFYLSAWQPEMYFLNLLKESLERRGVVIHGTLRVDTVRGAMKLAEIAHPIDSLIRQINKISDNLATENLLKIIGAERRGLPGTSVKGLDVMKQYFSQIGIDTTALILADGSGVSFYNCISPDMMVHLLRTMHSDSIAFGRLVQSFPIAGVDGTLRNRMKGTRAAGNVQAKTGTITGVSALSGFVETRDGRLLTFSIMNNHFPGEIRVLREIQNKIMEILAGWEG